VLNNILNTIITSSEITLTSFLICTAVSLVLGVCIALIGMYKNRYSQSLAITLAVLPAVVQVIIMLVNGNIGAGVAVAGAFGLVRFRSASGTAKEIALIFLAMTIGLATGMGYVGVAVILFAVLAALMLVLTKVNFGSSGANVRELRITIPENLDYDGLFDDLFEKYTKSAELDRVKTSNMGTLYQLSYRVRMNDTRIPREFLDEIRTRNGNLDVICGRPVERGTEAL